MKPKILLVDDEANILRSYTRGLRKEWDLVTAQSGKEGLELIDKKGPFSVIVSDFNMPFMNGITFLAKTIEKDPESVRVMLTGEGDFQIATQALNEGNIFRFVTKPCSLDIFNKILKDSYKQYRLLQVEKEARENELKIAGEIQKTLLSTLPPHSITTMEIAVKTIPSRDIDGDFIDFYEYSNQSFDLVVGDVMGKGLHAALVGAGAKNQLLRILWQLSLKEASTRPQPSKIVEGLNVAITPGLEQIEKFITMVYTRFDNDLRKLTYVDAGHPSILRYSSVSDSWMELKNKDNPNDKNFPLGFFQDSKYPQKICEYDVNDIFLIYSDGLLEGTNTEKIPYENQALHECLNKNKTQGAKELLSSLVDDYCKYVKSSQFFDDLTVAVVKILS